MTVFVTDWQLCGHSALDDMSTTVAFPDLQLCSIPYVDSCYHSMLWGITPPPQKHIPLFPAKAPS